MPTALNIQAIGRVIIVCTFLLGLCSAYYPGVTIGITPDAHPVISQYHAQDVYGQYSYGYVTPTSTKTEERTPDGVTRGGYSYIDSNGLVQTVEYMADAIHGFRVVASNLPRDLPEVAFAKAEHLATFQAIKQQREVISEQIVRYSNPATYIVASPQELPEVRRAREEHLALFEEIKRNNQLAASAALNNLPANDAIFHYASGYAGFNHYGY